MAIKTSTCYSTACDVCGYELDADGDGIVHSGTPDGARDYARESGWWVTQADALCEERDAEHLAKAQEIARSVDLDGSGEALSDFRAWLPAEWRDQIAED